MEKFYDIKKFLKGILTKSLMKKIAAVLVIGAFCLGGGAYYHCQQKMARKVAENQARTVIVENFAKENNIALIGTDAVHALVAKAIGVEDDAITYKEISLREFGKKDKPLKKFACDKNPATDNKNPATENNFDNAAFKPVYKVACVANDVRYKLYIDAVNGKVINIDVG